MCRRRRLVLAVLLTAAVAISAEARQRAARAPHESAAEWLTKHAYRGVDAIGMAAGSATMIGLGDGNHGAHEFFQTKLQMIQDLVLEDGVTVVGFEGTFPDFTKLDDYVLGGDVDVRAILRHRELGYWFWAADEIVAALDWIRSYNLIRGDRPAVEVAGIDVWDVKGAETIVESYLDSADPAAATRARDAFNICPAMSVSDCKLRLQALHDDLAARETELVSRSSQRAYDRALHAAHIAAAGWNIPLIDYAWRDENMAANAIALKTRMAPNARMVLWAHDEHVGKTIDFQSVKPMGKWLDEQLGAAYFAVGSCAAAGSFRVIAPMEATAAVPVGPLIADSYEALFQSAGIPLMIIPLRGNLPGWLSSPHHLQGGTADFGYDRVEDLRQKFDAILYFDRITPATSFW